MQKALSNVNRDIVYSLCQYGLGNVWEWGGEVGGNCWRTTGDITDTWESMSKIGFSQGKCSPYAKPGNWNDPDMLVVGKVGWGPNLHPTRLTYNEQYTHISLWALLSSPLLIGCDLAQLDEFTINLLSNDEVIDIDQDPLGKQAVQLFANEQYEIWVKDLEDGTKAVGLFNKTTEAMKISLDFKDLKIIKKQLVRDVWRQKDLGTFANQFESLVPTHGVCLIKLHDLTEVKFH
jgi:alpha-galactosidase